MGRRLLEWYRRLDAGQRSRGARIALSIVAVLLVAGAFGPILSEARRIEALEAKVVGILEQANVLERTAEAEEFLSAGTVTLDGRSFGDGRFRGATHLFDEAGELMAVASIAEAIVAEEVPAWAPGFLVQDSRTCIGFGGVALAWLLAAVWAGASLQLLLIALAAAAAALPFLLAGRIGAVFAIGGIATLGFSFVMLVRILLAFLPGWGQIGAVAAVVVREAVRQKAFVIFIVLLLVTLPLIPLWIDPATPLRYQLQVFIGRSIGITYAVAASMTLVLGAATVAFEIRDRQIMQLMVKPLSRGRYLLGKWTGVLLLDGILLAICGLSIFLFIQYLQTRPAADAFDAQAVRDEVLVARVGVEPTFTLPSRARMLEMIDETIEGDPLLRQEIDDGTRNETEVRREIFRDLQQRILAEQRSIAPADERIFEFTGLQAAKRLGGNLTLRYCFYAGESDPHSMFPLIFRFPASDAWTDRRFVPAQTMNLPIPASLIDDEGTLTIGVANLEYRASDNPEAPKFFPPEFSIFFEPDGLELLYPISSFEANFLRAMLVTWIKLAFLAMLAVGMAAFLSFPVACLVGFAVFLAAEAGPFLAQSVGNYRIYYDDGSIDWAKRTIRGIAAGTEWALRSFGSTRPGPALVEGRLISWSDVGWSLASIGIAWSGVVFLTSLLVFRRKELAVYSGQG
jgi:ABC-type transport system involved in multi-copper enzyme maturation permease subunit